MAAQEYMPLGGRFALYLSDRVAAESANPPRVRGVSPRLDP